MECETRYCLALYSSGSACMDPVAWLEFALDWCNRLGTPADAVCISGEGYYAGPQKPSDAHAQLQRSTTIEGLEIYRTLPGYKQLVFGWEVGWTFHREQGVLTAALSPHSAEAPLSVLAKIAEDAAPIAQPGYGTAYARDLIKGPLLYAVGMSAGLGYSESEMREGDRIAQWMFELIEQRRYLDGMLRDVYPGNLLTHKHLSRTVGGKSLANWIESTATRGVMRQLTSDCWLWQVGKSHIHEIRNELAAAGLIICA